MAQQQTNADLLEQGNLDSQVFLDEVNKESEKIPKKLPTPTTTNTLHQIRAGPYLITKSTKISQIVEKVLEEEEVEGTTGPSSPKVSKLSLPRLGGDQAGAAHSGQDDLSGVTRSGAPEQVMPSNRHAMPHSGQVFEARPTKNSGQFLEQPSSDTHPPASAPTLRNSEQTKRDKIRFLALISKGSSIAAACREIKRSRTCIDRWRSTDATFAEAWRDIWESKVDDLEQGALSRATKGAEREIYWQGQVCGVETVHFPNLTTFMLSKLRPTTYGSKPEDVKALSPQEQAELARQFVKAQDTTHTLATEPAPSTPPKAP